eukprot:sb/3468883/
MHSRNICHRDIKAENIFFSGTGNAKLGDFGFSIKTKGEALDTFCGSPPYAAPELFKDDHKIGYLGTYVFSCILWGMPFRAENVSKLKKCILDGTYLIPAYVSEEAATLIRAILIEDPEKRLPLEVVKEHPWLIGCTFPVSLPLSSLQPNAAACPETEQDDQEAQKTLQDLGVPDDLYTQVIERASRNGPRNAITGTYRIALHKAQKKRISPAPITQISQQASATEDKKRTKKKKFSRRLKACSIM